MKNIHIYLYLILAFSSLVSCKKSKEPLKYLIESGVVGVEYNTRNKIRVNPENDLSFVYKSNTGNNTLFDNLVVSENNQFLYVQRRDSNFNYQLDEVNLFNGKIVRSVKIPVFLYDMVIDYTNNQIIGISYNASSFNFTAYLIDLSTFSFTTKKDLGINVTSVQSGMSFMRQGMMYFKNNSYLMVYDTKLEELRLHASLFGAAEIQYDVRRDCVFYFVYGTNFLELKKYDFKTSQEEKVADIMDVSSILPSSSYINVKTDELMFYSSNQEKVTISLKDYLIKVDREDKVLVGTQYIFKKPEISLTEIEH